VNALATMSVIACSINLIHDSETSKILISMRKGLVILNVSYRDRNTGDNSSANK